MISPYVYPSLFEDVKRKEKMIQHFVQKVCEHLGITLQHIKHRSNKQEYSEPRQMAIVILAEIKALKSEDIAHYFRKHRTIIYDSRSRVSDYCDTNPEFKQKFEDLKRFVLSTAN